MPTSKSEATWEGNLKKGSGTMNVGHDAYNGKYTFASRFEGSEEGVTNPEELIGAALAGCFSMALSNDLDQAGHAPDRVHTTANVHFEKDPNADGFHIARINLNVDASVPGIEQNEFERIASNSKENCPVSKALRSVDIQLQTNLNT